MFNLRPEKIYGVVEGFYGDFFSFVERNRLIEFLSKHNFNFYLYGPKKDRYHREKWRSPYPKDLLRKFQSTISLSHQLGIQFCYAISPGLSISYQSMSDLNSILNKFEVFYDLGVRNFSLFLDDIQPEFTDEEDKKKFNSFAYAHAHLCNSVLSWLSERDQRCSLSMCPTFYSGRAPFNDYLFLLGNKLEKEIDVIYTGPQVCSQIIDANDIEDLTHVISRAPLIWDNYPVNDGEMKSELHVGPIRGRDQRLPDLTRGILINPMNLAETSKIPLRTYADFLSDPISYDPDLSWQNAIIEFAGESVVEEFRSFAEITIRSCLKENYANKIEKLIAGVIDQLDSDDKAFGSPEFIELEDYIKDLSSDIYRLVIAIENPLLRAEILPWVVLLENILEATQIAMRWISMVEIDNDIQESEINRFVGIYRKIKSDPKTLHSQALQSLIERIVDECNFSIAYTDVK